MHSILEQIEFAKQRAEVMAQYPCQIYVSYEMWMWIPGYMLVQPIPERRLYGRKIGSIEILMGPETWKQLSIETRSYGANNDITALFGIPVFVDEECLSVIS